MEVNIASISDPSVSFKVTKKLKLFVKENKEDIKKFKEPPPKNILGLISSKEISLKVADVEWLNSYLKHKRTDLGSFIPLSGHLLDKEINSLLKSKDFSQCFNYKAQDECRNVYLHELLGTSVFQLPKNEAIPRNPVLAARVEKLKKEQEEREYKAMTRNIDTSKRVKMKEDSIAYQIKMMNRHLIAVGQFILSVAAGFAFGFIGVELLIGGLDFGFRLLLGIAIALTIALAEFYFLAKHLTHEELMFNEGSCGNFQLNNSRGGKTHKD